MRRSFVFILFACIALQLPSWGAEQESLPSLRDSSAKSSSSDMSLNEKKLAQNANAKTQSKDSSLLSRVAGFLCGTACGIPICAVRKPIDEEKYGTEQLSCGSDESKVKVPAALFYLPFATVTGVLEAPCSSLKHSWQNFDKPFSKEQFSLREAASKPEKLDPEEYSK